MQTKSNKYLWTVKLVFGLALLFFICWKVWNEPILEDLQNIQITPDGILLCFLVIILMPVNWLLETAKWKLLMDKVHKLSWRGAFLSVLAGVSTGLLTPNRIGNFIGRTIYTGKEVRTKSIIYTFQTNLGSLFATISFGIAGALIFQTFIKDLSPLAFYLILLIVVGLVGTFFFNPNLVNHTPVKRVLKEKTQEDLKQAGLISNQLKVIVLLLSMVRYLVYLLQFYLLLLAFGITEPTIILLSAIAFVFLITTAIPSFLFGKLFVREASALFVLTMLEIPSTIILITAFLLWFINLAIPSLFGAWVLIRKT
ncbi:flippase-like domain-containing protein [Crocinitomix catalasitica]|nr:flippase-like domain-containing protein [Crocinitomix catalasitica]